MSYRKEKKYKLTISDFNSLKGSLLEAGMNRLYQQRTINSLYYDSDSLDMYHQSEEGVLPRKKVRIRWYNSATKSNLETKISSVEGRFKITKPMSLNNLESFPRIITDQNYGSLTPSLLVSYQRDYYLINNMRLTFDSSITYKNFRISSVLKFKDAERVMEIKVGIDTPDDFIENLIPYPTSRFSKYSRGLLFSNRDL
jgi:hypothetical protein